MEIPVEYEDSYNQLMVSIDNNSDVEELPQEDFERDEMYLLVEHELDIAFDELSTFNGKLEEELLLAC